MTVSTETRAAVQRMIERNRAARICGDGYKTLWQGFLAGGEPFPGEWKTGDADRDAERARSVAGRCSSLIAEIMASPQYKTRPSSEWADEMTAFALEELRKP